MIHPGQALFTLIFSDYNKKRYPIDVSYPVRSAILSNCGMRTTGGAWVPSSGMREVSQKIK